MSLTAFMLCFCWLVCVFFLVLMWSWPNVIMEGEVQQLQIILKWSNSNINSKDKEKDLGHAQTDVYTVSKYHCWIVQQKRRACYCFTIITLEGTIISTLKFCLILRPSLQLFRLNISQTKLSSLYLILGTWRTHMNPAFLMQCSFWCKHVVYAEGHCTILCVLTMKKCIHIFSLGPFLGKSAPNLGSVMHVLQRWVFGRSIEINKDNLASSVNLSPPPLSHSALLHWRKKNSSCTIRLKSTNEDAYSFLNISAYQLNIKIQIN